MQPMNKERAVGGKEAVGSRKEAIGVVLWAGGHGHALAAFKILFRESGGKDR